MEKYFWEGRKASVGGIRLFFAAVTNHLVLQVSVNMHVQTFR
jgi:hypothetical protein